jgi:Holliday junction resolvasome RuvABC endonuclease subunit
VILAVDPGLATCGWAVLDDAGRVSNLGVIITERDSVVSEATDRARRAAHQGAVLAELVHRYNCGAIACEAMSFGGPPSARYHMAISVGLSWGVVTGIARTTGIALYSVPPKLWQRAVQPEAKKKIDYPKLEAALAAYVDEHAMLALAVITKSHRNHPLDAVGIGLFVALRREQADRIVNEGAAA